MVRVYVVASKVTDSVTHGFLPAARRLGLDITVLTDRPADHGEGAVPCDVWDHRTLIAEISERGMPDAVFSNSDHLQVQTALAAAYFGLPGKDWRSALRAKNKALMRRRLAAAAEEDVRIATLPPGGAIPDDLHYPLVVKPAEGVASEDVFLAATRHELAARRDEIAARRPAETLLAEEYLPGQLRTLETLGDGETTWVLGGFRTDLDGFIEQRLTWEPDTPGREHVLRALTTLGVGFGACHTEYVTGQDTRLIEVNDRAIGDHCDFLLQRLTGVPLFELALRVHLGERLPERPPAADRAGIAEWVLPESEGTLLAAPRHQIGGIVEYWPVRDPGDRIERTGTNRDYLGTIIATGPDTTAARAAITEFRKEHRWEIG